MKSRTKVAVIGSGNIGTDLMIKIIRRDGPLEVAVMIGIDPHSDGLRRARSMGVHTVDTGVQGLVADPLFADVQIIFDATSAEAHRVNAEVLRVAKPDVRLVDLTPAAIGPYCIAAVNLEEHLDAPNINMVTCGGQATVPIVAAVSRVASVKYAEIVASIASRSAGPGTRANIDEFTETTTAAIEEVGGAEKGKAIIVLNPAEPPLIMRDTVYTISTGSDRTEIAQSIDAMVERVQSYVPGYRLKQSVQFEELSEQIDVPGIGKIAGLKTTVFLEVEGSAHYLPAYAGNLDIMTAAALRAGEAIAEKTTTAVEV